ncbi:hypothetical protein MUK42_28485 [Musa troglodytarum]|nr:hypothetical protein MUK42_28485 [Musa troglodytarum]URD90000.1 hypothetical protein MUK42_28485 [Musa troglodytarum]URD90007.1 hypothetical protein MUK42_28485 [Musa troglodytarum]
MGMRGNPEGRLASKVALLCCAFLFIFSVLSLTAGNSSGRDRSGVGVAAAAGARGGGGGNETKRADGARVASATVHIEVRRVHPVLASARPGSTKGAGGRRRVLPRGLAVQMRRPPLRAVTNAHDLHSRSSTERKTKTPPYSSAISST